MTETLDPYELRDPKRDGTLDDITDSVGLALLKRMHVELTQLQTPWQNTPEAQQQQILDRLRAGVYEAVGAAVRRIAGEGFAHVAVTIDSLSIKDEAKAAISVPRASSAMHDLADMVGQRAMLVFVDEKAYTANMERLKALADQPELPLEGPGDEDPRQPVTLESYDPSTKEVVLAPFVDAATGEILPTERVEEASKAA